MSMLADSGAVALEAIIVASAVVPALILVGVCWIFTERRSAKMDERGQLRTSSRSSAKGCKIGERLVDLNGVARPSHARRPRATCCVGEEASTSSYSDAKRGAISAQPYRRLSVSARRPRAWRSS